MGKIKEFFENINLKKNQKNLISKSCNGSKITK